MFFFELDPGSKYGVMLLCCDRMSFWLPWAVSGVVIEERNLWDYNVSLRNRLQKSRLEIFKQQTEMEESKTYLSGTILAQQAIPLSVE